MSIPLKIKCLGRKPTKEEIIEEEIIQEYFRIGVKAFNERMDNEILGGINKWKTQINYLK